MERRRENDQMAISLASLKRVSAVMPPRILVYGPPGMGKTTFASEFPSPVFIQVEDGTPSGLEIDTFGHLQSFSEVMEALYALANEQHDHQTVVIDSIDKLEPLVWAQTCEDNKWSDIESPGYGKGYIAADAVWRELFGVVNLLRNSGMAIVFIAHSTIDRFDDPQTTSYSRYDIRIHKRAMALFQDDSDAILFINQDVTVKEKDAGFGKKEAKATGGGNRFIYTEGRPSFVAKNRYGFPDKILYRQGEGFAAIAPYLPGAAPAAQAAE